MDLSLSPVPVELPDGVTNAHYIIICERSIHGQHEATGEHALSVRQADRKTEFLELMHGLAAPLNQGADAVLLEIGPQVITPVSFAFIVLVDVEMIGVAVRRRRQSEFGDIAQSFLIEIGDLPTAADLFVIMSQLAIEERSLQVVEAGIEAPHDDFTGFIPPMIAQEEYLAADLVVIGQHSATITQTPQCLGRVEADGAGGAKGAGLPALEPGAESLGRIFDDQQTMPFGDGLQRIHVAGTAIELGRHQGAGSRRDGSGRCGGIHQMVRPAFHGYRRGAGEVDGGSGRDHGVRAEDHLISRANACRAEGDMQPIGGVGEAEGVTCAGEGRQMLLEVTQILLRDESAAPADVLKDRRKRLFLRRENVWIVKKWDRTSTHGEPPLYVVNHYLLNSSGQETSPLD